MLDEMGRDVRYAFRLFTASPGFSFVVVLTLALGIGANTAIFSLIDALMLRSLPVPNPQALLQVGLRAAGSQDPPGDGFSYAITRALAAQTDVFTAVGGFSRSTFEVGPPEAVVRVPGAIVTGGYYDVLGLNPAIGRLLAAEDDEPGAPLVAVIGYGYWERRFGRSAAAIGQAIDVNGQRVTVVGVSPRGFVGATVGSIADITMAAATLPVIAPRDAPLLGPGNFWLRVLARTRPEVSAGHAASRLNVVWPRIADAVIAPHWPPSRRKAMAESTFVLSAGGTGWTHLRQSYRKPLLVLMAGVAVVLLIACANVASLLLARTAGRRREIAVRLAIGAGRARIVRQMLIESTLLSLTGAAAGVALAWVSSGVLVKLLSGGSDVLVVDLTPGRLTLAFTAATAIATTILFGLAPAWLTSASDPAGSLRDDTRTGTSRSRLLPALISVQVALSLVMLAGAGLFVRTLQNLQHLDPGFEAGGVLLVNLDGRRSPVPPDLIAEVERLPGVVSASLSTHTPLSGSAWSEPAVPAGQQVPERDNARFVAAGPGFLATMGIRLLAGREFSSRDSAGAAAVAMINEEYAKRHFAGQNPVGRHLTAVVRGQRRDLEVVGLVRNTSTAGLRVAPPPAVYVAYAQLTGDLPTTVSIRASGSLSQVAAAIQQTLQSKMPGAPIEVRPLAAQVDATIVQERMMAALASSFGALALILVCVGLYGLLAYTVAQRTREIGIRIALGARGGSVLALVLGQAAQLVSFGIAIGLPAAWLASRWVASLLFGLTPTDPVTIGGAILLLAMAALPAACLPAHRASRVDPLVVLRHE